jgi:hypothetical protein
MTMTRENLGAGMAPAPEVGQPGTPSLADVDEGELARRALANDCEVWRELVRRYEPSIRVQLARTLSAGADLLCSDSVDETLGEYWIALLNNDRAWLRRFNPALGHALSTWLTVLAWDVANKHLRKLRRWRAGLPMSDIDLDREPWNARAMRFLAFMETIQPDPPEKKPFFKWR